MSTAGITDESKMPAGGWAEIAVPDGAHGEPANVLGDLLENAEVEKIRDWRYYHRDTNSTRSGHANMTIDPDRIPDTMLAWPLFGAGLENLGVAGRPARWPTPRPAPDQILVRSDAVGLCYSDVKIIRQGGSHPRLYGRDLARRPIVQGHEVTMTVVEVGEAWRDRFRPGQRFALQADFYYRGRNLAYGYVFTGGLAQYSLLGAAALDGDEGCYTIPVPEGLGYAEVALTEPWACVEAAYVPRRRLHVKADGVLWIIGRPGLEGAYRLGAALIGTPPRKIIATDVPAALRDQLTWPAPVLRDGLTPSGLPRLAQAETDGGFDDIIVLDPTADVLDALPAAIATGGVVNLVGERPLGRPVQVDVGRVHYDYVVYLGRAAPTSVPHTGPGAIGRRYGREASRGSSAAVGRWAGCTSSACWRWPRARARSSSRNPTSSATRIWSHPLRRWRAAGASSSSCSTPNRCRRRITRRPWPRPTTDAGSTTSW